MGNGGKGKWVTQENNVVLWSWGGWSAGAGARGPRALGKGVTGCSFIIWRMRTPAADRTRPVQRRGMPSRHPVLTRLCWQFLVEKRLCEALSHPPSQVRLHQHSRPENPPCPLIHAMCNNLLISLFLNISVTNDIFGNAQITGGTESFGNVLIHIYY